MPTVTTTYLEILSPADIRARRCEDERFWIGECAVRQGAFNRFLYFTVGDAWAWIDKRGWTGAQWQAHAESERLRTFAAYYDGAPAGYYELHRGEDGAVEIGIFGLFPAFFGRGLGGALLTSALEEGFRWPSPRVWVHTCSLDHPAALANYQARGMGIFKIETHETASSPAHS